MQPEFITEEIFKKSTRKLIENKKAPIFLDDIKFELYNEGRSAQTLHVGPYTEEGPLIKDIHEYIKSEGGFLEKSSKHHHEIYLSDARKTDPEKLKTILRQPF